MNMSKKNLTICSENLAEIREKLCKNSTNILAEKTGHADHASMRPYVAIVDELKKREMSGSTGYKKPLFAEGLTHY